MGGHYPTSRGIKSASTLPGTSPQWNPNGRPASFPRGPRRVRRGTFNPLKNPTFKKPMFGGKMPTFAPFGKKPAATYPLRFDLPGKNVGRWLPWGAVAFGVSGYLTAPWSVPLPAGWSECWNYGGPFEKRAGPVRASCPGDGYRLLNLQVPSGGAMDPVTITSPNLAQALWYGPSQNNGTRMQYRKMIARPDVPSSTPYPVPTVIQPVAPIVTMPEFLLPLDPGYWLPLLPVPHVPQPVPVWGPQPKPSSFPTPRVAGNTAPGMEPGNNPYRAIRVGPNGVSRSKSDWHLRRKPERGTKENKYAAKGPFARLGAALLGAASGVYNGITEAVDLISAVYDALPDDVIAKAPNNIADKDLIPFMLGEIWKHRADIDMAEALDNIAMNAIEDAVWGRYFGAVDSVSRSGTNYSGFDRELGELNQLFQELYQ